MMEIKGKILTIDDDRDVLDLLEYNLMKEGYVICCLENSADAIATGLLFQPDLIILDIMMPSIDGFALCRQLRMISLFKETPIFFPTSAGDPKNEDEACSSGADDFIHKMLGLRSLVNKIQLVLRNHLIIKKRIVQFRIGSWLLSRKDYSVIHDSSYVKLAPEEFEVIYFIAQNAYQILTREQVNKFLAGSSSFSAYTTMDKCIDRLFSKLGNEWIIWKGKNRLQSNEGRA